MGHLVNIFDETEARYPLLHVDPDFCSVTINHATGFNLLKSSKNGCIA